jgi:hypothetical protein
MLNHANNIRIRIRNHQSVPVADSSIYRQIVAEQYARKQRFGWSANPDLYQKFQGFFGALIQNQI